MDNQHETKQNPQLTRTEMEATLVAKAWQDEDFKQELLSHPKAVLAREFDRDISESTNIQVLEESNQTYYLVIPKKPDVVEELELSEEQLEAVAGGWCAPDSIEVDLLCVSVGWDL